MGENCETDTRREQNRGGRKTREEKTRDREEGTRELTNASDQLRSTRKPQHIIKRRLPPSPSPTFTFTLILVERVEPPSSTVKDGPRGIGDGQALRGVGLTEGGEEVLQVGSLGFGEGRQGAGVGGGHCYR